MPKTSVDISECSYKLLVSYVVCWISFQTFHFQLQRTSLLGCCKQCRKCDYLGCCMVTAADTGGVCEFIAETRLGAGRCRPIHFASAIVQSGMPRTANRPAPYPSFGCKYARVSRRAARRKEIQPTTPYQPEYASYSIISNMIIFISN